MFPSPTSVDANHSRAQDGKRLHLLLLTDTSVESIGGSERFIRNLASRLSQAHYRITVVQLTDQINEGRGYQPLFEMQHVELHKLALKAVYGPRGWRALRKLHQITRLEQVDIVQSHHEKSDVLTALLPGKSGLIRISNRRDMGFNKSTLLRFLFRGLNHRFDCVVAPAQPILVGLTRDEHMRSDMQVWIPNGVDTERFRPATATARHASRQALGLAAGAVVFGCVASLSAVKRHCDLLDAFSKARSNIPDARLLLIGDGPLRVEITAQIHALGLTDSVILLGDRADIELLLPALDSIVLCSSTEGMSNALLEAMACALPIIATAVGGTPQLVEDQITGLLVPPCEPVELSTAMIMLANATDACKRMGQAARAKVEREFSLDSMAHAFDQLYRRLHPLS